MQLRSTSRRRLSFTSLPKRLRPRSPPRACIGRKPPGSPRDRWEARDTRPDLAAGTAAGRGFSARPALLRAIGESLGSLTKALASFEHPAARRTLKWDLAASGWIADHVHRVRDDARRARIERILADFTHVMLPALDATRSSVVHNDANDHNLLVAPDTDGAMTPSGIIDFGDLLYSHPACDVAIAIAYAMMEKPDPITAAAHVVAGYHEAYPLTEPELALLLPLARTRLAVSLVNSALQAEAAPENAYLQISADAASHLLERLKRRMTEWRSTGFATHADCRPVRRRCP
jgi:Ser/Thr protein kinase RdoA (MazF antagonist)